MPSEPSERDCPECGARPGNAHRLRACARAAVKDVGKRITALRIYAANTEHIVGRVECEAAADLLAELEAELKAAVECFNVVVGERNTARRELAEAVSLLKATRDGLKAAGWSIPEPLVAFLRRIKEPKL